MPSLGRRLSIAALYILLLLFTTFLLLCGFSAFTAELPSYALQSLTATMLKGGSPLGYKLGYLGTCLLVLAQLYSVRRRIGLKGKVAVWLRIHCVMDFVAPALILIHSGFPYSFIYLNPFEHIHLAWGWSGLTGFSGLAAWLILAVTVSGFFGRYLFSRPNRKTRRWFSQWRIVHVTLSALLYLAGTIHMIVTVWFKYVSAV